MSGSTQFAHPAARVTRGEERVETETGDEDCQQRQTQPSLAELAIMVITGTNVIICRENTLSSLDKIF